MCRKHNWRFEKHGSHELPTIKPPHHRINFYVDSSGCFIVTSHKPIKPIVDEYRHFIIYGKRTRIHRFIYEECFGLIQDGLVVMHSCDNTHCINPEHLKVGTHADNVADKVSKNRHPKGEDIYFSKLTEKEVLSIREEYKPGTNRKELGEKYNISRQQIDRVLNRHSWKHI